MSTFWLYAGHRDYCSAGNTCIKSFNNIKDIALNLE